MQGELVQLESADGSVIGVERVGDGPALVAVHGGTADRSRWAPVRDGLAEHFTLFLLDRRGRGASAGEADGPYAIEREAEDVLAVIEHAGEPVRLLGHSYGAIVCLEALPLTDAVVKALLYEPPFDAGGLEVVPRVWREQFARLIAGGQREEALELFYREIVGIDPAPLRALPIWQARIAAVHTGEREGEVAAAYAPDAARLAAVDVPVRVLAGTESPPVFAAAARAAVEALPNAELVELPGQGHGMIDADPAGFVAQVTDFF